MSSTDAGLASLRSRFADMHENGTFIIPNAWDVGSALVLQSLGFEAIATTSSGFAASLGRHDQEVTLAELVVHVADLCSAVDIPVSIDAEAGYSEDLEGLPRTVSQLSAAGAAGISIEDYVPGRGLLGREEAVDRVGRFVEAVAEEGLTVTARAENHLYGVDDLADTIERLAAYRAAGADVLYAPGLVDIDAISRVVTAVDAPVNVLLMSNGPTVGELSEVGVRRVSTGGALAFAAYGALAESARELLDSGTSGYTASALSSGDREAAFGRVDPGG